MSLSKAQVRKRFRNIEELAATLVTEGQQSPIIVSPKGEDGKYVIQKGERRWRACKHADIPTIDIIVNDKNQGELDETAGELIENIQRDDLTPLEIAEALVNNLRLLFELNAERCRAICAVAITDGITRKQSRELLNDAKRIQEGLEKAQLSGRGGDNPGAGAESNSDHLPPEQEHVTSVQGDGHQVGSSSGNRNLDPLEEGAVPKSRIRPTGPRLPKVGTRFLPWKRIGNGRRLGPII